MVKKLNILAQTYKQELAKGDIQNAYAGLVKFMMKLRNSLSKSLADSYTFGGLLQGYMDYTYIYYTNDFLKSRKLKMGLVLNHVDMRFEVWLLGQTAPVQKMYWQYFKDTKWNEGRTLMPQYSILESVIVASPDLDNLEALSAEIEAKLLGVSTKIQNDVKLINP